MRDQVRRVPVVQPHDAHTDIRQQHRRQLRIAKGDPAGAAGLGNASAERNRVGEINITHRQRAGRG